MSGERLKSQLELNNMPKTYSYNIELKDDPNVWICYKEEVGLSETRIGYIIELHHYEKNNHRCSCPHGEHRSKDSKINCKHIEMVLDEEFRRNKYGDLDE